MKKSTFIDYAVLLAALSGRKKKRLEKIDRSLQVVGKQRPSSGNQRRERTQAA